jgi:hypothetical protein
MYLFLTLFSVAPRLGSRASCSGTAGPYQLEVTALERPQAPRDTHTIREAEPLSLVGCEIPQLKTVTLQSASSIAPPFPFNVERAVNHFPPLHT